MLTGTGQVTSYLNKFTVKTIASQPCALQLWLNFFFCLEPKMWCLWCENASNAAGQFFVMHVTFPTFFDDLTHAFFYLNI